MSRQSLSHDRTLSGRRIDPTRAWMTATLRGSLT
jgi:hypothetical protein